MHQSFVLIIDGIYLVWKKKTFFLGVGKNQCIVGSKVKVFNSHNLWKKEAESLPKFSTLLLVNSLQKELVELDENVM